MKNKEIIKKAFKQSIPIMCSYLFVSIAYGIMMNEAGFAWYVALLVSFLIYTGAFQFLLITLLSVGASLLTIGVTALLMNSRQLFYWLIGTVLGAVLGNLIPFDLTGIDFCMTALFIIIFMDQLEKNKDHFPAIVGVITAIICLVVFGTQNFMLPSLIISSMVLLVKQGGTGYE